jgi:signal transduction histidine kinase/GAF domain-containing protein
MSSIVEKPFPGAGQSDILDRQTVDCISDCAMILDLDGCLQHINPAGLRLLEHPDGSKLAGGVIADFFEPDGEFTLEDATAAARRGESSRLSVSSRSSLGIKKWWEVAVSPVRAADGKVSQLLAIFRDTTSQRRREEFRVLENNMIEMIAGGKSLEEALEGLVLLIEEYSEDALCCILMLGEDRKTVQETCAPSFSKEYAQAVHGLPVGPRVGSCGTAMFRKARVIIEDIYTDPLWRGFDEIKKLSGGRGCWSTPILSDENEVVGSFAIYARVARMPTPEEIELMDSAATFARVAIDKHQIQKSLGQSEARNRAMVEAIPDWVFLTTPEGKFLDYHASDPSLLRLEPSDGLDRLIGEVIPEPLGTELECAIQRVCESGNKENLECSLKSENGQRYFEASVVSCDDGKALSIVREVTERRRAETEAAARRAELAHLGRVAVMGEISGALAHELCQPLAAMRTNADAARRILAASDPRLDLLRETIEDFTADNERAEEVINRWRGMLKKETPKLDRVDVAELAREVVKIIHREIDTRGVSVHTSSAGGSPVVRGDRIQLQQVMLNLILNACDSMMTMPQPERQLYLETRSDGEQVEFRVCDAGVGIPEGDLERIFEPFVSSGKNGSGLGLGLSISRSIIHAHQGEIHAENNPSGGATFRCRFGQVAPGGNQSGA